MTHADTLYQHLMGWQLVLPCTTWIIPFGSTLALPATRGFAKNGDHSWTHLHSPLWHTFVQLTHVGNVLGQQHPHACPTNITADEADTSKSITVCVVIRAQQTSQQMRLEPPKASQFVLYSQAQQTSQQMRLEPPKASQFVMAV